MRGLGIGIMVTALLMGVATDNKIPLSDAEIKMRALELGMVESDSLKLSDIPKIAVGSSGEEEQLSSGAEDGAPEDSGEVPEPGEGSENEDNGTGGETHSGYEGDAADSESDSKEESGSPGGEASSGNEGTMPDGESDMESESGIADGGASQENEEDGESVAVVIEGGATSYSVCQQLQQLGLVEDAVGFDEYLCGMGYSRSVLEGTFYIVPGTSQEEIARIITGKR